MAESGLRQYGLIDLPGANSGVRVKNQDVALGAIQGRHTNFRHFYIAPTQQPIAQLKGSTGGVPGGATGDVNILSFASPAGTLEQCILGAGQTLIVPTCLADGLEISADQAADEGMELCCGLLARNQGTFTIGTDPAFFLRCRCVIDDVSGTDDFAIGFRKNQAYSAAIDNYTDFAVVNLIGGQWFTETALNNAATVTTSLTSYTVADLGAFEVQINVSAAGAVTYKIGTADNMTVPSLAPAFTFDTGDVVTAFIYFLHHTDLADSVRLRQLEVGFQANQLLS